jgi:hypothetical protein
MRFVNGVRFLLKSLSHRPFLHRCLAHSSFIDRALSQQPFIDRVLSQQPFVERCFEHQHVFEFFLQSRGSLEKLSVDEGTLISEAERQFVQELAAHANYLAGPIIEIGTLYGATTTLMAQHTRPDKRIITVDNYSWNPWKLPRETHKALTRRFLAYLIEKGQVETVDMDKNAFYASYRGDRPALVFLDAIHTYEETKKDIEWAKRIGATIIAGHDYCFPGVAQAVDEAGGRFRSADSIWVLPSPYWASADGRAGLPRAA